MSDCPECYAKVLETMRAQYGESQGREWFSQRSAFLEELNALFNDGTNRTRNLPVIEKRIESEKEAWYRWVMRTYPAFLTSGDRDVDPGLLRSMLNDPDTSRDELSKRVWERLGQSEQWSKDVDLVVDLLGEGMEQTRELKKVFIRLLFMDSETNEPLPYSRKYLEIYERSNWMGPEDIVDRIVQDEQATMTSQSQRDEHLARLADLHRARTAMEQTRQKAKSQAAQASQTPTIAEELYNLPPCEVCQKVVPPEEVFSCVLCQLLTQIGGKHKLTVYCSQECYENGHVRGGVVVHMNSMLTTEQDAHVEKEHDCEAGDDCVQGYEEDEFEDDGKQTVICDACIDEKESAIYCSVRCATQNLPHHYEKKHGMKTGPEDIGDLVSPLWKLAQKTLKEGNPGLSMTFEH